MRQSSAGPPWLQLGWFAVSAQAQEVKQLNLLMVTVQELVVTVVEALTLSLAGFL